jgi:hypothetical protein
LIEVSLPPPTIDDPTRANIAIAFVQDGVGCLEAVAECCTCIANCLNERSVSLVSMVWLIEVVPAKLATFVIVDELASG